MTDPGMLTSVRTHLQTFPERVHSLATLVGFSSHELLCELKTKTDARTSCFSWETLLSGVNMSAKRAVSSGQCHPTGSTSSQSQANC